MSSYALHGMLAAVGCISAFVVDSSWFAPISFLSGQAVMVSVVALFSTVATMLIKDAAMKEGEEMDIKDPPQHKPAQQDREDYAQQEYRQQKDVGAMEGAAKSRRSHATKARVLTILLLPLKIILLLVPLFLYRLAGPSALVWFVIGLIGAVIVILVRSPPSSVLVEGGSPGGEQQKPR